MKQYLLAVHNVEGAPMPPIEEMQQAFADVDQLNKEMQSAGVWVFGGGLLPADTATVVRSRAGTTTVTDGPFAETKEVIVGFDILECADLDEAITVAAAHPMAHVGRLELRPYRDDR